MYECSIVHCGSLKDINRPQLTFHTFPKDESLKKKWLEIIGVKNINPEHKEQLVCSLHFQENCFNRTLDDVRLCDDAMPSKSLRVLQNKDQISKLRITFLNQRREIKCLIAKVQRRKKTIDFLNKKIKDLRKSNKKYYDECQLEDSAGPQDFLKRPIENSRELSVEYKYSKDIRKFALTLHFLSPKAYNIIKRTYGTCLPCTQTIYKWHGQKRQAFENKMLGRVVSQAPTL